MKVVVYEKQLIEKETAEFELRKAIFFGKQDLPKVKKITIIDVRTTSKGVAIRVEDHSAIEIISGFLVYGRDWTEEQAMEIAEEGLQILEKGNGKESSDKPFIKKIGRENGKLKIVWSDDQTSDETSDAVAVVTAKTA